MAFVDPFARLKGTKNVKVTHISCCTVAISSQCLFCLLLRNSVEKECHEKILDYLDYKSLVNVHKMSHCGGMNLSTGDDVEMETPALGQ